ncbi:methylated-DNA--[protein]-cysteine S-methyltransferase [Microbacterium sp. 2FI]|uniref:methylated-DNA--[protein]-cysteine S-methyltransferase n=1 Tax=Microbacterium sp. 2FI TaxID=2502193 RepID=UPI0010F8494C|nr:methylated-DNA--[protein]-cysteine S-methyltransferase [Microbacterium sp. 2FI]
MTPEDAPRFLLHPSPVGDILIVTTDAGIVTLHPVHDAASEEIAVISRLLHAAPIHEETDAATDAAAQLDEYFAGARRTFDLALDWRLVRGFTGEALRAVCDIPYGETAGYGEVAIAAGSPRAARAVGTACATTPFSIVVPVHRVVRADGSLGEYGGHPEVKRFLIDLELAALAQTAGE